MLLLYYTARNIIIYNFILNQLSLSICLTQFFNGEQNRIVIRLLILAL